MGTQAEEEPLALSSLLSLHAFSFLSSFKCVCLPECISVHYMHAVLRLEDGIKSPGTGVTNAYVMPCEF